MQDWIMMDQTGGVKNAGPGQQKTELGHFSRRRNTTTSAQMLHVEALLSINDFNCIAAYMLDYLQ